MKLPLRARDIPGRLVTGAFILNSGIEKASADEGTAQAMHGMASGAYPFLAAIEPKRFVTLLSAGEITLGAALLAPVVPTVVAGAGLALFSAGLLGMWARTAGMRRDGSIRPSQQGVPIAKDVWMLGIGTGFVVDDILERRR